MKNRKREREGRKKHAREREIKRAIHLLLIPPLHTKREGERDFPAKKRERGRDEAEKGWKYEPVEGRYLDSHLFQERKIMIEERKGERDTYSLSLSHSSFFL